MSSIKTAAIAFIISATCALAPASAQTRLFSDDTELQAAIEGPIGTLVRTAQRNTDAYPAVFILQDGAAAHRFDIQLSAGGISRRTGGICSFPPLRLNFDGAAVRGTPMQGQNKLKLVTRCRTSGNFEQLTVLEYLAYRMYNEVTPMSFRVRPVRVAYRDSEGRRREETQFNFLIEDQSDMARRNERRVPIDVQSAEVRSSQLDANAAATLSVFQYMIGNLDWDALQDHPGRGCCHNVKLIAASAEARTNIVPVPYDFDYSGFVDAPYALAPEGLGISSVRQRVFRGYCSHNDALPAALDRFRARRDAIFALIEGETRLSESERRNARTFIQGFFEIIDDPGRVNRLMLQRCRG
ncbi:MAG: hypothetical protein JNJ63_01400 [Hyphomonadaceae bacterium]|nr:hypothetical protein [Hyphomonadaceae bacterium]